MCIYFLNMLEDGCEMGNGIWSTLTSRRITTPVVVILGATGTGKSKLAIQIAKKYGGEIISADSMQVYKGLDIITNKITPEEQSEAVHHFINCADSQSRYTVVDFRNRAVPLINNLLHRNKLPIIVGGTNYYIESLLWEVLIKPEDSLGDKLLYELDKSSSNKRSVGNGELNVRCDKSTLAPSSDSVKAITSRIPASLESENYDPLNAVFDIFNHEINQESLEDISNEVLHKFLQVVDPVMAAGLHPNDRRKVIRSLQVYQQHHCCHSDLISQQKSLSGGSSLGGPLRYKNSLMLWLQCDKDVLGDRLNKRVNQMIENGLIAELLGFHSVYNEHRIKQNLEPSYTEGIFQSIGFKEFHEYLLLPPEERASEKGRKLCKKAIEDVKLVTRRYSRKQVKWIRNRFLRKPDRQVPPVYALDATEEKLWDEKVFPLASHIIESTIQDTKPDVDPLPVEEEHPPDNPVTYFCDICELRLVGSRTWEIHMKSRKHHRQKAKLKKIKLEDDNENREQSLQ